MKRIKLKHGTARVDDNVNPKTVKMLEETVKKAYEMDFDQEKKTKIEHLTPYFSNGLIIACDFHKDGFRTARVTGMTMSTVFLSSDDPTEIDEEYYLSGILPILKRLVDFDIEDFKEFIEDDGYYHLMHFRTFYSKTYNFSPKYLIEKLYAKNYDVNGLIEKGFAIDLKTL